MYARMLAATSGDNAMRSAACGGDVAAGYRATHSWRIGAATVTARDVDAGENGLTALREYGSDLRR